MGYTHGFLLALERITINESTSNLDYYEVESYAKDIAQACRDIQTTDICFPQCGKVLASGGGHSCDYEDFWLALNKLCKLFPQAVFTVYHFYRDCSVLEIYSVSTQGRSSGEIVNLEEYQVGKYKLSGTFKFEETHVLNDLSGLIDDSCCRIFNWVAPE